MSTPASPALIRRAVTGSNREKRNSNLAQGNRSPFVLSRIRQRTQEVGLAILRGPLTYPAQPLNGYPTPQDHRVRYSIKSSRPIACAMFRRC